MQIYQSQVESQVASIIEQELLAMGFELVRIKIMGGTKRKVLQIMIDRVDGEAIKLADCEKASRHISVLMDVNDPIEAQYLLEVSSAGLNRPLTRHKDLVNNVEKNIKLGLKIPMDGQKNFIGKLSKVTESNIYILTFDPLKELMIDIQNIQDAQLIELMVKGQKKTLNNKNIKQKR